MIQPMLSAPCVLQASLLLLPQPALLLRPLRPLLSNAAAAATMTVAELGEKNEEDKV